MTAQIINARITSTFLGVEDHGIFTFRLWGDRSDGYGLDFGNHFLDRPLEEANFASSAPSRIGKVFGATMVLEVLRVLEVSSWEKLPGTPCRVREDGGTLLAIGHFIKDKWLEPKALYAALVAIGVEKE